MPIRRGDTVIFPHPPVLAAWAAVGGKKESEGPLAQGFDELVQDASFDAEGCTGWEQAESMLQQRCARHCLRKAGIAKQQVELAFAGDLQAQCTASNYTMRQLGCPLPGCRVPAPLWRKRCAWRPSARQLAMRMKYSP
ncbi:MAG: hypothetical protein ACLUJU_05430 [Subdoligranulum sp.]